MTTKSFYRQNGAEYYPIKNNILAYITLILFIVIEIWALFFMESGRDSIYMKIIPIVIILLNLLIIGKRVIINTHDRTVELSIFGFMKLVCGFDEFTQFLITKHRTNFIKTGISLMIKFQKNNKVEQIEINRFYKLEKVEALLEETRAIMGHVNQTSL
ncbi:hypothetical protein EZJ43_08025 [Pedobacter changchengzhani]|uniref:DUF304 domain-containing protein n=1 Tax=Pedobacter changchengzhani TaxID=2529274 RepID=A0A4R5MLT5_9SPHI|nr:hypothetical protein [Pedobacter changchengzhani]TDG36456.1 hypothetical protein EZJ43_08025 [Pedobacter changchengzhani]